MLVMPSQSSGIGMLPHLFWHANPLTVKRIVVPPVIELLLDAAANLEMETGRHRYVAGVEEAVDVAPQQKSVLWLMLAAVAIRANMSSFESRQRALLSDRAASPVDIRHQHGMPLVQGVAE
jgi:hypothetical protein